MPRGLVRYQQSGDLHFITFSCHKRKPLLGSPEVRDLFEESLERIRLRYHFFVSGYVVMPEHVHLLISEPRCGSLASALLALKLSVAIQRSEGSFWLPRYHDFNVFTEPKRVEKLRYIHRNPMTRGLVAQPADWKWSSFRHYWTGERGVVEIESQWTAAARTRLP
jgi:putative transposase